MKMIKQFFSDESGATMVEYAILVALLAIAVAIVVVALSGAITAAFQRVIDCLGDPTAAACAAD
jgi:pilus assembly protein Flp/PilA